MIFKTTHLPTINTLLLAALVAAHDNRTTKRNRIVGWPVICSTGARDNADSIREVAVEGHQVIEF
jgi:hypothetical protein